MKRRQTKFKEVEAADLEDYARITHSYMPYLIVVIDEIVQMMTSKNKMGGESVKNWTETHLVNLAAQGRSSGIVIVIATQIISAETLTSRITANFENRVCFGTATWRQSQMAIDDSRAEGLPKGRIILKANHEYTEYQSCLLSPQNRRLNISRITQSGPGVGLADSNEAKRFLSDAMLLVKIACEQFDGAFSNLKMYNEVREHMPKARVEEVSKQLVRDGVLIAGRNKRHGRCVAKAFHGKEQLLVGLYGTIDQTDLKGAENGQVTKKTEPIDLDKNIIDLEHQNGIYQMNPELTQLTHNPEKNSEYARKG